jgi:hypothetical protein
MAWYLGEKAEAIFLFWILWLVANDNLFFET